MPTNARRESTEKEGRVLIAVDAYKRRQFKSIRAAAAAFDVYQSTVSNRLKGTPARVDTPANGRKLDVLDENLLKEWIISADERGLAPQFKIVRRMAAILAQKDIGVNWVKRFINRHEDIRSKYTKRYDYQRALCEDPKKIEGWFKLVQNMVTKYGIRPEDIYNFDETGFAMGITTLMSCFAKPSPNHQPGLTSKRLALTVQT